MWFENEKYKKSGKWKRTTYPKLHRWSERSIKKLSSTQLSWGTFAEFLVCLYAYWMAVVHSVVRVSLFFCSSSSSLYENSGRTVERVCPCVIRCLFSIVCLYFYLGWLNCVRCAHCALDTPTEETIAAYRLYASFFFSVLQADCSIRSLHLAGTNIHIQIWFSLVQTLLRARVYLALVNFSKTERENTQLSHR